VVATAAPVAAAPPCETTGDAYIVVSSAARRLWLCAGDREVNSYSVRLARNGRGKRTAGDAMLPLGSYLLGAPRESTRFGLFIPIGYPSPQQAAEGYTGGAVGIHGPHRALRWLGELVNTFDTTAGCVGVATDRAMREIAGFARQQRARRITIR
jgi:murein L,D-transpeptidase YafK